MNAAVPSDVPPALRLDRPPGLSADLPLEQSADLPPELSADLPAELAAELSDAAVSPGAESPAVRRPPAAPGTVVLTGSGVTTQDVFRVAHEGARVEIGAAALDLVLASRRVVEAALIGDIAMYGLNTGLGPRRNERVSPELLFDYQRHIVLSHAGAVGDPLDDEDVRATLFARLAGLACGGSGASAEVLRGLADLLNAGVHPVVPEIGSVGASDLAALAAVGEVLIGHGRARYRGVEMPGAAALRAAGLAPVRLQPKDALAVISANAVSVGIGATTVLRAYRVARLADLAGALTLEALAGNLSPFDPEVHEAKPFPGQGSTAAHIRLLLEGSYLHTPGAAVSLQDPLSMRTIPQVHGAFRQQVGDVVAAVTIELNSRADNPLISPVSSRALSNGNFHPMVLALGFDALRIGAAHVGIISERRTAKLAAEHWRHTSVDDQLRHDGGMRGLPTTIAYSAATLSSQLKQLAMPATLTLPPLGQDVEDHGTLAPLAVLNTRRSLEKLEMMFSIEILLAAVLLAARPDPVRLGAGSWRAFDLVASLSTAAQRPATTAQLVARLRDGLMEQVVPDLPEPDGNDAGGSRGAADAA